MIDFEVALKMVKSNTSGKCSLSIATNDVNKTKKVSNGCTTKLQKACLCKFLLVFCC
jgi:hypothetical protein